MAGKSATDEIAKRIKPTLDKVAVRALRAWLRSLDLTSSAQTRQTITELIAKEIAAERLSEPALESALIGFEEASEMRVYLFKLDDLPTKPLTKWLPNRLLASKFAITNKRIFGGDKKPPMSPVYAELVGNLLRLKWAEEQTSVSLDERTLNVKNERFEKRIVLIADFGAKTAEVRINPPDNRHTYYDRRGQRTAEAYYKAYIDECRKILDCSLLPLDLRSVVRGLVQENPRVVRIQIDNHTNQVNSKSKTVSARSDVRDDPDWNMTYASAGATWAWDSQSFYWLPKSSSGFLTRELFSQVSADEGFVKVNADCSDEELNYVVSQLRAR